MLESGQKVEVYYNLHKKCFSVRDKKTRLVIAHMDELRVRGKFKVSQKGRERVLREKRKNVHAVIDCVYVSEDVSDAYVWNQAYYNPYVTKTFVDHCSKEELNGVYDLWLTGKDVFYKEVNTD